MTVDVEGVESTRRILMNYRIKNEKAVDKFKICGYNRSIKRLKTENA